MCTRYTTLFQRINEWIVWILKLIFILVKPKTGRKNYTHQKINLRSASDFANQLNVHVNHLNRAVKETTQKTTTQIISERILQESKILLRHSAWSVSEIAYALGFTEVTHFNNFFKKHVQMSPLKFRNVSIS